MNSSKKLGVWFLISLIMGNMIGTGIFLLPSSVASFKWMGFIGWVVSAIGMFFIAKSFSMLSKQYPLAGGPYVYVQKELGRFFSFFTAFGYWIAVWAGLSSISIGFVSYLSYFFSILKSNSLLFTFTCILSIWGLVFINSRGVKKSSWVQVITTVLKIIPLLLIGVIGIFYIRINQFPPFSFSNDFSFSSLNSVIALTVYAFLGIESATVPANHIKNPEKSISKATIISLVLTSVLYLLCSISLTGILSFSVLEKSNTPFADAAVVLWGNNAANWIAAGAAISGFGCLNGWILIMGQLPIALAKDKLMPAFFMYENKHNAPSKGLIIGAVLASLLLLLTLNKSLLDAFNYLLLITTISNVLSYFLPALALLFLLFRLRPKNFILKMLIALLAFVFSGYVIFSNGQDAIIWIVVLLSSSAIIFYLMKRKQIGN